MSCSSTQSNDTHTGPLLTAGTRHTIDTPISQSFSPCAFYRAAAWTAHNTILDRNYNSRQVEQALDEIMARCSHFQPREDSSGRVGCDGIACNAWGCLLDLTLMEASGELGSTPNALPESDRIVRFKESLSIMEQRSFDGKQQGRFLPSCRPLGRPNTSADSSPA